MAGIEIKNPEIVEFGPYRIIGMNYQGKNENQEVPALWGGENGFLSRAHEIEEACASGCFAVGICRCIPGVSDGSFEYIAGLPAGENAAIPSGMIEAVIGKHTYAVFEVPDLASIGEVWGQTHQWAQSSTEWESTCGPEKCECMEYPFFELYPEDWSPEKALFIYFPVNPKQ